MRKKKPEEGYAPLSWISKKYYKLIRPGMKLKMLVPTWAFNLQGQVIFLKPGIIIHVLEIDDKDYFRFIVDDQPSIYKCTFLGKLLHDKKAEVCT